MAKTQNKLPYNPFAELADIREEKTDRSALATQTPEHLATPVISRLGAKSQNPAFVKLTAYIPRELHRAVKIRLLEQGREISDLVEVLVSDWLKRP